MYHGLNVSNNIKLKKHTWLYDGDDDDYDDDNLTLRSGMPRVNKKCMIEKPEVKGKQILK